MPEWSSGFLHFLKFQSEFSNKEFMIWATVSSGSCFCWLYRAVPTSTAKNVINLISVLTIWWYPCIESSLVLLEEGVCYDQYQILEFNQTHGHRLGDATQPSHPLSSPSLSAFNPSQHQGLFQWVSSSHQVTKVLEFQLQHQSFRWIFRTDFL